MNITESLTKLVQFHPLERLRELISRPIEYLPEPPDALLPSIVLGGDGPTLQRLLIVTPTYLCDVDVTTPPAASQFDFVLRNSIRNYRFRIWTHEIKEAETAKASFEIAEVKLIHDIPSTFATVLEYAGTERQAWLAEVVRTLPIQLLVASRNLRPTLVGDGHPAA